MSRHHKWEDYSLFPHPGQANLETRDSRKKANQRKDLDMLPFPHFLFGYLSLLWIVVSSACAPAGQKSLLPNGFRGDERSLQLLEEG